MKEWSELEERYQEMKVKDPKAAEDFRKKMSAVSTSINLCFLILHILISETGFVHLF